jgi:hypothetical protein
VSSWCKRADLLERRLPDAVLLLPVDGDDVTLLAGTGGQLWTLLTEPRSVTELTSELTRRYEGDPNTIRSDIEATLSELEVSGLVGRG